MKIIILNIAFFLLALTKDLNTASADNLRAPEAEGPTQTDVPDGLTIHIENGQVHRKLKGKGKGKGKFQNCQDISGKWLVLDSLTTYQNNGFVANAYVAFDLILASDTLCNYFGREYYHDVEDPQIKFEEEPNKLVALTSFPGYLGAKEGDNQFLSFASDGKGAAPGSVEVYPGGNTATIYRDAICGFFAPGSQGNDCTSKSVMRMAKFPDQDTVIIGKTHSQLVDELEVQTGTNIFDSWCHAC
ncbi:hypothetical protein TrCOL_g5543 [Triparma columacea]|uniref:Uncharacterized protein n=1 Tax=Triparma columacea TaxID=722753 RepID=A0A9W7GNG7_9STRA|nr:hypothetical protein TrCOL_g5543 [Triparma columacea]